MVSFVNDCGVIKVNYLVKSPCMFSNVGTFSTLFCIPKMFFNHMTRTAPRAISLETIRKKVPYEGRTRQRAGKTRTALLEMRMAPAKTMRNNFVAKKCFLKNE